MKVVRVAGGLALLQKCKQVGADLVPLEHDDAAHRVPLNRYHVNRSGIFFDVRSQV